MTDKIDSARKKAELIINNKIYIPKDVKLPYPMDRSTAGPGLGMPSIALAFGNKNIKLVASRDENECFSLQKENGKFHVWKDKEIFLKNVKIVPILFHAPGQAFINLEDRCTYNCAFCNLSNQGFLQKYEPERFVKLILTASKRKDFQAVALTSGIYPNNDEIINKMCYIIKRVRQKIPHIPMGVEPCISNKKEIMLLKKAGADEIKINLQIPDKDLFEKICPDFHYAAIFNMLKKSVELFGKGKVTSNILYGLGESDKTIIESVEKLAKMGVVPTLRKIRTNQIVKKKLELVTTCKLSNVTVDRILLIAGEHKKILEKYGLTTKTFKTMCHKCGCCDLVPFWDV